MLLDETDIQFIRTQFGEFEGWCHDDSAYLSTSLLNDQAAQGWSSGVVEIGVYLGKYLSVLYRKARLQGLVTVGIDTFEWEPMEKVVAKYNQIFGGTDDLRLVRCSSRDLTPAEIIEHLRGRKASFISVDGDHAAEGVEADLKLAQQLLTQQGIVVIDDFLNQRAIGVSEGSYRYFLGGDPDLVPFLWCANKLYTCRRACYDHYKDVVLTFTNEFPELPFVQEFKRLAENGRQWVEQPLLGVAPWIF